MLLGKKRDIQVRRRGTAREAGDIHFRVDAAGVEGQHGAQNSQAANAAWQVLRVHFEHLGQDLSGLVEDIDHAGQFEDEQDDKHRADQRQDAVTAGRQRIDFLLQLGQFLVIQ